MKKLKNTSTYKSRTYKIQETRMGRNWHIIIYTKFKTLEEFPLFYITEWLNILKSEEISFIMYRFSGPFTESFELDYLCIICYVELKKNSRATKLKNFFGFANNIVEVKLASGLSKGSIDFFVMKSKEENTVDNLFWFGKPRREKLTINCSNFNFIIENYLFKKARLNFAFPDEFSETLKKDHYNLTVLQKTEEIKRLDQSPSTDSSVSFLNLLKVNTHLRKITRSFVKKCAVLIKKGAKGLTLRNLFFDYLSEFIKLEINNLKQNENFCYQSYIFYRDNSKRIFFNWSNVNVILRYFIETAIQTKINDTQLYNLVSTKEISNINVAKESFKKRLRDNKRVKELKMLFITKCLKNNI